MMACDKCRDPEFCAKHNYCGFSCEGKAMTTINGLVIHHVSGEPVKAGDLVAGEVYRVDVNGLLTREEKS